MKFPKDDIRSPHDFEQMAKLVRPEDFDGRMLISSDPDAHRAEIQRFLDPASTVSTCTTSAATRPSGSTCSAVTSCPSSPARPRGRGECSAPRMVEPGQDEGVMTDIETPRLRLRRFTAGDEDLLIELDGDPAVMEFLTGGKPTSPERIRREILPRLLGYYERWPHWGYFAGEVLDTGAFIGWFAMRPKDGYPDDVPELGYRLC